jgi:hypothetical protein
VIDWLLKDRRTGKRVVMQVPNLPLLVWLATAVPRWVWHPDGRTGDVLAVIGTTALAYWAVDEVARGVNPLRRIAGGVVLVGLLVRWVSN